MQTDLSQLAPDLIPIEIIILYRVNKKRVHLLN